MRSIETKERYLVWKIEGKSFADSSNYYFYYWVDIQ
jgi:hypothetical protein